MRRILIVLALLIPLPGLARSNSPIDKLFKKYAHQDGVETLNLDYISCKVLSFIRNLSDSKTKEADILKKINGIHILTVEDKELNKNINFYKELEADGFLKTTITRF